VIISGDSDFSPLVSKLRENAKTVIGVGVKMSTSDLLINNCDEFIFYDDLVRAEQKKRAPAASAEKAKAGGGGQRGRRGGGSSPPKERDEEKVQEAMALVVETIDALSEDRDEDDKIWGSMVKQAIKRRKPGFNEGYFGFRSFNELLEEGHKRGLIDIERDEKSGGYAVWALE
jgi:hypothetical protein